jgi:hypothetical protein
LATSIANDSHFIRLNGPWEMVIAGQSLRIVIPAALPAGPFELKRSFGRPTNLAAADQLHLVFRAVAVPFEVQWNGIVLNLEKVSDDATAQALIPGPLLGRNTLVITGFISVAGTIPFESCQLKIVPAARSGAEA